MLLSMFVLSENNINYAYTFLILLQVCICHSIGVADWFYVNTVVHYTLTIYEISDHTSAADKREEWSSL